jgi:hypothetical protein
VWLLLFPVLAIEASFSLGDEELLLQLLDLVLLELDGRVVLVQLRFKVGDPLLVSHVHLPCLEGSQSLVVLFHIRNSPLIVHPTLVGCQERVEPILLLQLLSFFELLLGLLVVLLEAVFLVLFVSDLLL